MGQTKLGLIVFVLFGFVIGSSAVADTNTRVTNPSAFVLEIGGRGLLWSFGFDRVLSENLSAGIGLGSIATSSANGVSSQSSLVIPAYANYYFSRDAGSLFVTAGATVVASPSSVAGMNSSLGSLQFSSSPIIGNLGLGYEYRSDAGFLVRGTAYAMFAQNIAPWGGITLGYSF